jgi:hypothetical protein
MKTIRPYTTVTVRTTDGRYRHMVVTTVTDQDTITGRVGLMGNKKTVNATRQPSTDTRGEEFVQA